MVGWIRRYTRWLHTQWPAGRVERLPQAREDGSTNVPGLYLVGDISGIPLLKFSSDAGARAVRTIAADRAFRGRDTAAARDGGPVLDLVIVGCGVAGLAAAVEAQNRGLVFEVLETSEPLSTIVNFPKGKPIYTYPSEMTPAGDVQFTDASDVKEGLLEELRGLMTERGIVPTAATVNGVRRTRGVLEVDLDGDEPRFAHRVIVAIGRTGNFRRLDVPGEDLDHVYNRLHDPKDFCGQDVLVVGGGDSALETAIALAECGSSVTLSYRGESFSRPKPENVERVEALASGAAAGTLRLAMSSEVKAIQRGEAVLATAGGELETVPAGSVFVTIGREAPLEFFRRSGVRIGGEWTAASGVALVAFLCFCVFVYHWKGGFGLPVKKWFQTNGWFPFNVAAPSNPANLAGTIGLSMQNPSFYYALAYTLCIVFFGIARVRRRRTPYVTVQTATLAAIQVVPLFLLPFVLLPWAGHNGWFDAGAGRWLADALFPATEWDTQGREYWRSVGLILAWPLLIWNVFTDQPLWLWLGISFVQTFVIIPWIVLRWGKGAYCGWICSCGALAETMGDAHRHKMPHGPGWNRFNMLGQFFLVLAGVLLVLRIASWAIPGDDALGRAFALAAFGRYAGWGPLSYLNYAWFVDLLWAGIFGVAFYFWFSGRVWCRFACPLAALMHVYARFTSFRILADKKKCISCNVCTSVCHQGIDVMNFANKGLPMEDPQCVRCSACVQSCPTGVLSFGRVDRRSGAVIGTDRLPASRVRMTELTINGTGGRRSNLQH